MLGPGDDSEAAGSAAAVAGSSVGSAELTATYGDAGRNILRGPGQFNIDMSLIKNTRIGRFNTEIRLEAFNVLNRPNHQVPNNTFGPGPAPRPGFGQPTAAADPRQVQLGLRMTF